MTKTRAKAKETGLLPSGGTIPMVTAYAVDFLYVPAAPGDSKVMGVTVASSNTDIRAFPASGYTDKNGLFHFTLTCRTAVGAQADVTVTQAGSVGPKKDGEEVATGSFTAAHVQIGTALVKPPAVEYAEPDEYDSVFTTLMAKAILFDGTTPVPNFHIGFDIDGNVVATDPDDGLLIPKNPFDDCFYAVTNNEGIATINLAGTEPGTFLVTPGFGDRLGPGAPADATYTQKKDDIGGIKYPLIIEGEIDGELNLTTLATAYVEVFADPRVLSHNTIRGDLKAEDKTALFINDELYLVAPLAQFVQGMKLPKTAFKTDVANDYGPLNNTVYWMATDPHTLDASISNVMNVSVSGQAENHAPTDGKLPAPIPPLGLNVINDSWLLKGDLQFSIPPYAGVVATDKVVLSIYINAYDTESGNPNSGLVSSAPTLFADVTKLLTVTVPASQLVGYNASRNGVRGLCEILYTVQRDGVNDQNSKQINPPILIATS